MQITFGLDMHAATPAWTFTVNINRKLQVNEPTLLQQIHTVPYCDTPLSEEPHDVHAMNHWITQPKLHIT